MAVNLDLVKKDVVDVVAAKIREFQENREIHLPANFSAENAMKAAWLAIQETVDKDKRPALEVCTKVSISNALLNMIVLGLNPSKKQGYFIVRGVKLCFDPSYFGLIHIAKEVDENILEVNSEVVYKGDVLKYELRNGKKFITKHEQTLESLNSGEVVAAYCIVEYTDGRTTTVIKTWNELLQAWKQSSMRPVDDKGHLKADSTHAKFTADMAKKTVIRAAMKHIVNTSNDNNLLRQVLKENAEDYVEEKVAHDVAENANGEVIDIEAEITDEPTAEAEAAATTEEHIPPAEPEQPKTKAGGPDF